MQYVGNVDKAYISSVAFLDQREILEQVLDVTSEDATILDIMEMTGRKSSVGQMTYSHFTNDYIFTAGTISAIDATNNGEKPAATNETLVITLSDEANLPIVGELALLENKRQGRVTAVNKSTRVVTISPFDDTAANTLNPSTSVATSQKVYFFSGAYGEGSDKPEGKKPKFVRSENQLQIFKTYREITDVQKAAKIEVKYDGKPHVFYKMQHDCLMEHRAKIAYQFLIGKKASYNDADGYKVTQTQGLREYIKGGDGSVLTTGGLDVPLTVTITKADLKTMSRGLDKRGAGAEFWLWAGPNIDADIDDVILALGNFVNGGIVYNSWGAGNGAKKALDLGVSSFKLYNRSFHKKKLSSYDHEGVFPSTFGDEAYLIPTGKVKTDASGTQVDSIKTRFLEGDGESYGGYTENRSGRMADRGTKSVLGIDYLSIMGLEVCGVRQFGIFSKA